ncbi:MAG: PH domain-containing protein [Parvibaculum sp.]|jgi:uncharacterized membrane protein YdbT with pleckstrin-like domain|uniref:PH domain-containing protein n=1 Tax=Parvibaculum sp. TaxID=2024848 RepID=UPI0028508291|nr:PH domain-containing protein [Parvibaculum sp.]MDR3498328.1 PH domain-containing protein [Parvibaculum sp.]
MSETIEPTGYLKKVLSHDEKVELIVRQHMLVLFGRILLPLLLLVVVFVGATGAKLVWSPDRPEANYAFALVLLPLIPIVWRYIVWRNHFYVMTNRRVIQVTGVFSKEVSDSLLEKLNDVKTDQTFLGRIFGYGDIEIMTASETGVNNFRHISKPLEFKRAMLEAKEELEKTMGRS